MQLLRIHHAAVIMDMTEVRDDLAVEVTATRSAARKRKRCGRMVLDLVFQYLVKKLAKRLRNGLGLHFMGWDVKP